MTTYRERRLAKAERLRGWAEKREEKAGAVYSERERYRGDVAFWTQPGHIPQRDRLFARMDHAHADSQKAEEMRTRAASIERAAKRAIYSDDLDAAKRLQERISSLEAKREQWKAINTAWRKGGVEGVRALAGDKVAAEAESTMSLCPWLRTPLDTTNLSADIRRNKQRLEEMMV